VVVLVVVVASTLAHLHILRLHFDLWPQWGVVGASCTFKKSKGDLKCIKNMFLKRVGLHRSSNVIELLDYLIDAKNLQFLECAT